MNARENWLLTRLRENWLLTRLSEELEHLKCAWRKKRYCYVVYCLCVALIWLLLLVSLRFELFTGQGIVAHIFPKSPPIPILNIEAVKETAKTIGFGSIVIAWIYATLDKDELGYKYGDLLRAVYPVYPRFVLSHLIAILLCAWLVESKMLESALISLSIVIVGGIIHWRALSTLVLVSSKRKKIAIDVWTEWIDKWGTNTELSGEIQGHAILLWYGRCTPCS